MSGSDARADAEGRPPDLRLIPAALAAWAGMWVATSGLLPVMIGVAVVGLGLTLVGCRRRSWPTVAAAGVLVLCVATGGLRWWLAGQDVIRALAQEQAVVVIDARIEGSPRAAERKGVRPPWWSAAAQLVRVDGRGVVTQGGGSVDLSASGDLVEQWRQITPGTLVRVTVRLSPDEEGPSSALARAREPPLVLAPPGPAEAAVERVRQSLRDAVAPLPREPRSLVPALVVGDTSGMPEELVERFSATGLTHLTAVSGANLVLLLAFLGTLGRAFGILGWWLRGLLGVGVLGFVLLCRGEPSVLRAAAMGLVALAALGWSGPGRSGARPLAAAVIAVLLVDPSMARSAGFTLSVVATAGIVFWAARWAELLGRWLPAAVAEGLAVALAAQLATQPIVTALSGRVSLVGLLANLAAGPLVGPATVFGLLAAGASLLWVPLGQVLGWLAGGCAQGLCWIALVGSGLPGAQLSWPSDPVGLGLMAVACLAGAFFAGRVLGRPALVIALSVLLAAATIRPPSSPGWPPPGWVAVFCDVGQGDATVLRAGADTAILVDSGPDPPAVVACLRSLGIRSVAVVLLTHFHADHVGGLSGVLDQTEVGTVITSSATSPASAVAGVAELCRGTGHGMGRPGLVINAGDVRITVLAARSGDSAIGVDEGESAMENDGSLVMKALLPGVSILLAGDVQEAGQTDALARGVDLSADVVLVPHHGSAHQNPDFLAAVGAKLAVFSAGRDNDYGHPAPRTQRLVASLGVQTARTDQQGSIAISVVEGRLVVTSQR